ncbi:MAG: DUF4062 domain-containing protein [Deltaproteobacteria bacterium]|nr:DUF4062 domain-containing protein [Deltaproteobacteria bacterium]
MSSPKHKIRIFVSSTFLDFKLERDVLRNEIFSELEKYCQARNCQFQWVDLSCGVSDSASRKQLTMKICEQEISRCQHISPGLNFLGLVGERYGWRPLPDTIPENLYQRLRSVCKEPGLVDWYKLDKNAIPPEYYLTEKPAGEKRDEVKLQKALLEAFRDPGISVRHREYVNCCASVTEQEMWRGIYDTRRTSAFCFFRKIKDRTKNDEVCQNSSDIPTEFKDYESEPINALKKNIGEWLGNERCKGYDATWDGMKVTDEHLMIFKKDVYEILRNAIDEDLKIVFDKTDRSDVIAENRFHDEFCRKKLEIFQPRPRQANPIKAYLSNNDHTPFALVGDSGSGKSSILARMVNEVRQENEHWVVVQRFIGATPASAEPLNLLRSICDAILTAYKNGTAAHHDAEKIRRLTHSVQQTETYERLVGTFKECLTLATAARPLLLVVDALDQLNMENDVKVFSWVAPVLPDHVKFVVSGLNDKTEAAIRTTVPGTNVHGIVEESREWAMQLFNRILESQKRKLSSEEQLSDIELHFANDKHRQPLYVSIIAQTLVSVRSGDPIYIFEDPSDEVDASHIIHYFLDTLSGYDRHGPVLVNRAVGYLAAAHSGISEKELQTLLTQDADMRVEFKKMYPNSVWKKTAPIPRILWSRLYLDLRPFLVDKDVDNTVVLSFFHREFARAAASWAFHQNENATVKKTKAEYHEVLASYFSGAFSEFSSAESAPLPGRQAGELPCHLTETAKWKELVQLLSEFSFLDQKIQQCGVTRLLQDFSRVLGEDKLKKRLTQPKLDTLARIDRLLRLSYPALAADATQLAAQILGRCRSDASSRKYVSRRMKKLVNQAKQKQGTWLKPLVPRLADPEGALKRMVTIHLHTVGAAVILEDDTTVVTGSAVVNRTGDSNLKIWCMETGQEVGVLPDLGGHVNCLCCCGTDVAAGVARYIGKDEQQRDVHVGDVVVFSPKSGKIKQRFTGHALPVSSVVSLADGSVLSASYDGIIRYANPNACEETSEGIIVGTHGAGINALAISRTANILVSASFDQTLKVWDISPSTPSDEIQLTERHLLAGHYSDVKGVTLLNDSPDAVSVDFDGQLIRWDLRSGQVLARTSAGAHCRLVAVCSYSFSKGTYVFSTGTRGELVVWDCQPLSKCHYLTVHTDMASFVGCVPGKALLLTASDDTSIKIWDAAKIVDGFSNAAEVSGKLAYLEVSESGKQVRATGRLETLVPYGKSMFYEPDPESVRVFDFKNGAERTPEYFVPAPEYSVIVCRSVDDVSADNRHKNVIVVNASSSEADIDTTLMGYGNWLHGESEVWQKSQGTSGHRNIWYSPPVWSWHQRTFGDAGIFVQGIEEGTVMFTDLTCARTFPFPAHKSKVMSVAFDIQRNILFTASTDYTIRGWDIRKWIAAKPTLLWVLNDHTREVNAIAVARDAPRLLSVSDDWTAMLWDISKNKPVVISRFTAEGPLFSCAISPDGTQMAVADENGLVHVLHSVEGSDLKPVLSIPAE